MLRPRRLAVLSLVCVIFVTLWISDTDVNNTLYRLWYFNGFPNSSESVQIACYYDKSANSFPQLYSDDVQPDGSIFFLETSCHDKSRSALTPRQACAVESAAKMNPDADVYVLFPSPVTDNSSALSVGVQQLLTYNNIKLRHVSMDEYFRDTPLDQWYSSGMLRTSRWPMSHASDVLRYITLWKFGGIYLDLDVVVTKRLSNLVNFAGAESSEDVAAGVLSFSRHGVGHELAAACVHQLRRDFRGYDWGHNGPGIITNVLQDACQTNNVIKMTPDRCKGFTVFPPRAFYPIPWRQWQLYFNSTRSTETLRKVLGSYAIHVWNKFSSSANVTVGSNQPYGVVASQFCPRVYSSVGSVF
ncbi:lactosylceramide 4-alpha-galactosyltransferase-like [Macrosteles quadrilineatus]|uniref:lactosylceramide 4-alpha-galactosyltransferase-like n=1 Tax=Macrosteles quadrilineatus TaxID=74068 RepID=UPI0023E1EBB7|nr:lactosylceramide 4-alpha-galactosyltransferase-like [Macrosteles quadrilineatus]